VWKAGVVRLAWEIAIGSRRLEWSALPPGGLGSGERWPLGVCREVIDMGRMQIRAVPNIVDCLLNKSAKTTNH